MAISTILLLVGIVGYFGKRTLQSFDNNMKTLTATVASTFDKFSTEMKSEFKSVHQRVDRIEGSHRQLLGEHKVITRDRSCTGE